MKKLFATALLLMVAALFLPAAAPAAGPRVAVFPLKNNGQPQQNGLASGLQAMFVTDLMKVRNIEVVDPQKVASSIGRGRLAGGAATFEDAVKAASALEADYMVMGEFVVFGSRFRIDIRLYDLKTGSIKMADKGQAKEDQLFEMVDDLSEKIVLAITGALPAPGGGVVVESDPPGASVLVDGEAAGETPGNLRDIKPGVHRVELNLAGYQSYSESVTVMPNKTAKVQAKLVRLFGGIRVWWKELPMSDISIEGESIPVSLFQGIYMLSKYCKNIPSGTYTVSVRLPYKDESAWSLARVWRTYSQEVSINAGEVTDIFIYNSLYSPAIEISSCGSCAANWDFRTKLYWFEM